MHNVSESSNFMKILEGQEWQVKVTEHLRVADKPLVVIVGPTASGKTGFSIEVAKHLALLGKKAEVVNGDSRQLYKQLDIGTAKVTPEEMDDVSHHLFSVLDPKENVSIAWYKDEAYRVIDEIHARGNIPVLVGGSMLYISTVIDGLDPLPPSDPEVRKRLEKEYDEDDGWSLYDRLTQIDPDTAKNFEHQNKQYVVRALELYEQTGVPPSQLKKTIPPPYQVLMFGMEWPRSQLTERIDVRTKQLLQSGWIEEVEGLVERGYTVQDPGMKSHGYREIMAWLSSDEPDREALYEVIASKTRQYAKRQMTWWKDDERIYWIKQ